MQSFSSNSLGSSLNPHPSSYSPPVLTLCFCHTQLFGVTLFLLCWDFKHAATQIKYKSINIQKLKYKINLWLSSILSPRILKITLSRDHWDVRWVPLFALIIPNTPPTLLWLSFTRCSLPQLETMLLYLCLEQSRYSVNGNIKQDLNLKDRQEYLLIWQFADKGMQIDKIVYRNIGKCSVTDTAGLRPQISVVLPSVSCTNRTRSYSVKQVRNYILWSKNGQGWAHALKTSFLWFWGIRKVLKGCRVVGEFKGRDF